MKKLLFFLLLSSFVFGQDISPYYPTKQSNAYRGNETSQLTYYDSLFVQGLIPNFLSNNMGMVQISSNLNDKTMVIKQTYQDSFSTGKLVFELQTEKINSKVDIPEVIKSIKISGTKDRVFSFFINYWNTTINWDSKKSDVERLYFQDIIKLHFNNGKPFIVVTNSTYKTSKDFEQYFNKLLEQNPNLQKPK